MMTKKTWLPLLPVLVLTVALGGVLGATESDAPPAEPLVTQDSAPAELHAPQNPAPAAVELEELLLDEAPLMSVQPTVEAASTDAPSTETSWWQGICWTSCWPCNSDDDCPWGQSCRFNVQCP